MLFERSFGFWAKPIANALSKNRKKGSVMWYVVQVASGKEQYVLELIETLVDKTILKECFIPQYELIKKYQGEWTKCTEILFPGYLFLVTNQAESVARELRQVPSFTKLLGNNNRFVPLSSAEVALINSFTGSGSHIIEMSKGIIEGDKVVILKGPLMRHSGLIKKIDRHKRLAYLELMMLGRITTIKVGLEVVKKQV